MAGLRSVGITVTGALAWAHLFTTYVGSAWQVKGPSMAPTFEPEGHGIVLVNALAKHFELVDRGDVVMSTSPVDPSVAVCKRVVAVAGDEVLLGYGRQASRIIHGGGTRTSCVVPPGHVWLEGDNPARSRDSRRYGPVPIALLKGTVFAQIWPLRCMKFVSRDLVTPTSG